MSEPGPIECGLHGTDPHVAFLCRHLAEGVACGFCASTSDPSDRWPDAQCDACVERVEELGPEDIRLVCTKCWEESRDRNREVPDHVEAPDFGHRVVHELQEIQEATMSKWKLDRSWKYDDNARTITFGNDTIADVTLVGSYSTRTNTFQWSWQTLGDDNPEIGEMARLRVFGEARGIERLTTPNFACEEADGWEMTAIAAKVLGAEAVFRMPLEHVYWFMLLDRIRVVD